MEEVGPVVGLTQSEKHNIIIHEDNAGALILANTLPSQATPCSKHYTVKTHWWFRECITCGIKVIKVETKEQLGDIFTKCLPQATFEYLRKKIMGW